MATLETETARPAAALTRRDRERSLARLIRAKTRRVYGELGELRRLTAQLEASLDSDTESEDTDDGEDEASTDPGHAR